MGAGEGGAQAGQRAPWAAALAQPRGPRRGTAINGGRVRARARAAPAGRLRRWWACRRPLPAASAAAPRLRAPRPGPQLPRPRLPSLHRGRRCRAARQRCLAARPWRKRRGLPPFRARAPPRVRPAQPAGPAAVAAPACSRRRSPAATTRCWAARGAPGSSRWAPWTSPPTRARGRPATPGGGPWRRARCGARRAPRLAGDRAFNAPVDRRRGVPCGSPRVPDGL
jgi:hypothetical protein